MSWPASVRRREASPPHVFGGDEGLLRPTAARQPYATADRGGHEARKDPVFALTEDASGPDDDDLEVARNAQQPLLFVELQPLVRVRRLQFRALGDPHEMVGTEDVRGRNVDEAPHPRLARGVDDSLQQVRSRFPIAQAPPRRHRLGAEDHNLDARDSVRQGFVVGVGIELDDRHVGRHRA